ncbi:ABC transporter permease [Corynebacterium epidermidicanis]|uniref:Transport permease protein n=1 Tax=Corynebacterium epidermidicanis TaxID=1050174 RepID=A0A0G3GQS5_9CORY|nr:ABC transporter permease [Corynebacterium epidermidicanis]AKK01908.1 ABC-type multidrug transport system, permease component [Corynebacterium epidermidicanis]
MNLIGATMQRILREITGDRRTVGLIVAVPSLLLALLYFVYDGSQLFNQVAVMMLGVFPMLLMFIVASVTMQRERKSGTLERLMTTRLTQAQLLAAYGLAFSAFALVQSLVLVVIAHFLLGVVTEAPIGWIFVIAPLSGIVGGAFGLLASAFAENEFQAVQFMPVFFGPQFFLGGILVPRGQMNEVLHGISNVLPMSYVIDLLRGLMMSSQLPEHFARDIVVVVLFAVAALVLAATSMPRATK